MATDSIVTNLKKYSENISKMQWKGTVEDYIELISKKPSIHMNAHERVLKMILSHGTEAVDGVTVYNFFKNELFGVDEPINEFMSYLRAAATGSEVSRRILLMYGPTSSGKSQLAVLLKRGLEAFSKTEDGAFYVLTDSPMYEDPLCAIPLEMRTDIEKSLNIKIYGELNPLTSLYLKEKYDGNFLNMPVKRVFMSEKDRVSIGSFLPSTPKNQDLCELVGSIDLSTVGEFGSESDPRAYRFDGELNISNRGMMEFIEMLKVDQKFLYVLLTLAQEKNIKTSRFSLISADEFVLGHTNFSEYSKFLAKDEMEALHDRTIVVRFPYNLSLDNEVKIYEKLIAQSNFSGKHIAPHTLRIAAMFAVLSRLKDSNNQGLSLMKKLKMYNGDEVEGFTKFEANKFKKEFDMEGMDGLSPRFVINRIASTLSEDNISTITPIMIIRSLKDGMKSNPKIDEKENKRLDNMITFAIEEYEKLARNDVQKAFFVNFNDEIKTLLSNYMDHIEAYLDNSQLENEWGHTVEPNERLMRSVEEKIGITESGKKSFRQEIYRKMLKNNMNYEEHPTLKTALEKQLFEERQDIIKITVSTRNPDEAALKKINVVIDTLCKDYGYNVESANELLRYVNSLMVKK